MNKLSIHCPHFAFCSGCSVNTDVDRLPIYQEAQTFFGEHGVSFLPLHTGSPVCWRMRAKLAVRGSFADPLIGLYKEGTHDVMDIPLCKVHHPRINQAVSYLKEFIQTHHIEPYDELNFRGVLRYIQLVVERRTQKVQLTLVLNEECSLFAELGKDNPEFWHSIWFNRNTRRDNVVFGEDWQKAAGETYLWETIAGVSAAFLPSSFAQANVDLFERLVERLPALVDKEMRLVEYYAGVGVMGLVLAGHCKRVICAEINASAKQCFDRSREKLPVPIASKITFETGAAGRLLNLLGEADCVLVDPPRKGLDRALLDALIQSQEVKQIIYVSCGWKSFKRDSLAMMHAGWSLEKGEAYLFFPGSEHIEILAVYRRKKKM